MSPKTWCSLSAAAALVVGTPAISAGLVACASEGGDDGAGPPPDAPAPMPPEQDAGAADASVAEECTGDDCEFFTSECTADALCPSGPFHPSDPMQGLPWLTTPRVLVGRGSTDVWLAGSLGTYSRFDGASWATVEAATQTSPRVFWLTPSGEIALTDHAGVFVRGSTFVRTSEPSPGGFASASLKDRPPGFGGKVSAGFAPVGSRTLWLATDTSLWRLVETPDGELEVRPGIDAALCATLCGRMRSIHGSSSSTIFAAGDLGAVVRVDDADSESPRLTPFNPPSTMGLHGVFAASDSDVWAVGGSGTILHHDGSGTGGWEVLDGVPTVEHLNTIWGRSKTDIWVGGDHGVVLHYDGARWSRVNIAGLGSRRPRMTAIWGTDTGTVYVAGQGVVLSLGGTP